MLRLKKILENRGVQFREYASLLGMTEKTLYNKLTCATDFSYGEWRKTCIGFTPCAGLATTPM